MTDKTQPESTNSNVSSNSSQKTQLSPAESNPCPLCRVYKLPTCKGHGGGGGGGDSGGGSNDGERNDNQAEKGYNKSPVAAMENSSRAVYSPNAVNTLPLDWRQELRSSINIIELDQGLLSIKCDNLRGTLTLQIKSGLSAEEVQVAKQAQQMLKAEFDLFKEELFEKGVAVSHFTAVIKDESLTIQIPHPKYFADFIQRLAAKNLLPLLKNEESKLTVEKTDSARKRLSPFDISKGPMPKKII
jgi:hypothetical protein